MVVVLEPVDAVSALEVAVVLEPVDVVSEPALVYLAAVLVYPVEVAFLLLLIPFPKR